MRTNPLIAMLLALAACGHPDAHESSSSTASAAPRSEESSERPASSGSSGPSEEVLAERFGDGAKAFAKVRESLLRNYYREDLTEDDLYRAATAGMLEKLDPSMKKWNRLIPPSELSETKNDLRGEVVGVGVHVQFDDKSGYADVLATLPGSPSEKSGLLAGDKIVTVNGKLYKGMHLENVVADIRGKAGESVVLRVLRGDQLRSFTIVRERIAYDQPTALVLPDQLGFVRIPSFTDRTPGAVREGLVEIEKKGSTNLVVDLRQCPGGSFERALETANLFLPAGTPIVTLKRRNKAEEKHVATGGAILATIPVVVLVNEMTASGCEILASALREGRKARIVGEKTLGKWSVQSLDDLGNGYAFKYTVSLFRTPSGKSLDGIGITPDIEVKMEEAAIARANAATSADERFARDAQLRTAREILVRSN